MDKLNAIILWAGLGCFILSFLLSGLYPYMITDALEPEATLAEITADVPDEFKQLKDSYPVAFAGAFPRAGECLTVKELQGVPAGDPKRAASEEAWKEAFAHAVREGRDLYIGEGCWHCHSQYVRPVANEEVRFGPVLDHRHYNNEMQRPVMWGTRRVGPDLTHEGGLRSNDWHVAHLWDPQSTSPDSIMPRYTWYFRKGWQVRRTISEDVAEREGLDENTSYPYPGIYDTKAQAEERKAWMEENPIPNLEEEAERLIIAEANGPDGDALSLIAYLQWLGRWSPPPRKEDQ